MDLFWYGLVLLKGHCQNTLLRPAPIVQVLVAMYRYVALVLATEWAELGDGLQLCGHALVSSVIVLLARNHELLSLSRLLL